MTLRRYAFLIRFGLLTLALSLGIAVVLSRVLSAHQLAINTQNTVFSSLGRASADLTPILLNANVNARISDTAYRQLRQEAQQIENFDSFVSALRLYRPDGSPIFPATAAPQSADVSAAIKKQDTVEGPVHTVNGEPVFTAYSPFANPNGPGYLVVIALDYKQGQIDAIGSDTQRFVFEVTWGACAFIFVSLLALAIAAQRELNRRQRLAEETFTQTMTGIAAIVDKRDPYTAGHSKRVSEYAVKCAKKIGVKPSLIRTIEGAALLHDVGKIGIPDAVLLKPAKLDQREREIIGLHPEIANEILGNVEAMCEIVPCIVHHHERWDGRGYPRKIAGAAIPLGARIIAVADTYDAMTTDRPYRRALSPEQAREELLRGAGAQWDAACVEAMVALIDAGDVPPPQPAANVEELARAFGQQIPL